MLTLEPWKDHSAGELREHLEELAKRKLLSEVDQEASTLDLCFPFFYAAIELPVLPFGCFTSFSIPLLLSQSVSCFPELFFMFFWCELTFIGDEPCSIPFRFFPWTNLSGGKLKFHCPFDCLRINHPWRSRWFCWSIVNRGEGIIDLGGAALDNGGAGPPVSAASTTLAKSAIQPDIEPRREVLVQFRRGRWKVLDA